MSQKYECVDFKIGKAFKSDASELSKLYHQIVKYANDNQLDIVNIAKPADGLLLNKRVPVIFSKRV